MDLHPTRALIAAGSRDWKDRRTVRERFLTYPLGAILIHGSCRGLDELAHDLGHTMGFNILPMPAPWESMGKPAGPFRNGKMLEVLLCLRDIGMTISVEAFPLDQSVGTYRMIEAARLASVEVIVNAPLSR